MKKGKPLIEVFKDENSEFLSFEKAREFKVEVSLFGSSCNSCNNPRKDLLVQVSHATNVYIVRVRSGKVSKDVMSTRVLREAVGKYNSVNLFDTFLFL
jgi:hypothetical protein